MPAKRLELGARARTDLTNIWTYTDERWGPDQAERYSGEVNAAMVGLAEGTRIGHAVRIDGYHGLRVSAHMIYYREQPALIRVFRVLHMRQDVKRHLGRRAYSTQSSPIPR